MRFESNLDFLNTILNNLGETLDAPMGVWRDYSEILRAFDKLSQRGYTTLDTGKLAEIIRHIPPELAKTKQDALFSFAGGGMLSALNTLASDLNKLVSQSISPENKFFKTFPKFVTDKIVSGRSSAIYIPKFDEISLNPLLLSPDPAGVSSVILHEIGHGVENRLSENPYMQKYIQPSFEKIKNQVQGRLFNLYGIPSEINGEPDRFVEYATNPSEIFAREFSAFTTQGITNYPESMPVMREIFSKFNIKDLELLSRIRRFIPENSEKYVGIIESYLKSISPNFKLSDEAVRDFSNMFKSMGIHPYASGGRVRGRKIIQAGEAGDEYIINSSTLKKLEEILGGPVSDEVLLDIIQRGNLFKQTQRSGRTYLNINPQTEFDYQAASMGTNFQLYKKYPALFGKASDILGTNIAMSDVAKVKVVEDFNRGLTTLQATLKEADGTLKKVTVSQDHYNSAVGKTDEILKSRTSQEREILNQESREKSLSILNELKQKFPDVYQYAISKDPRFIADESARITKTMRGDITRYKFSFLDELGNKAELPVSVDKYGRILRDLKSRTADFTESIKRNMGEFLRWSLAVGIVYTPMLKLRELIDISIQNQERLANVLVTLGEKQNAVNTIFSNAARIAKETGTSINGVLEGYNLAVRATGDVSDKTERYAIANKLLKDSIILAKLAGMDQATAVDTLVASLKQSNLALDQGQVLLDKWVQTSRISNVDINTLATSFGIVGEAALNAGLSIDELNGLIATIAQSGITSARETGNAVRAIVTGFYSDSAVKQLSQFGIAVTNIEGKARNLKDVMLDVNNAVRQGLISEDQLNKIGMAIGGGNRRTAQVVTAIMKMSTMENVAQYSASAEGQAQRALDIQLATVQTSITRLGNAFQTLAQILGTDGGVLSVVTELINSFSGLTEELSSVVKVTGSVVPMLAGVGIYNAMGLNKTIYGIVQGTAQTFLEGYYRGELSRTMGRQADIDKIFGTSIRSRAEERSARFASGVTTVAQTGLIALSVASPYLAQKQYGEAGAIIGGAVVGTIIAGGNPIGTVIGSSIVEIMVKEFNRRRDEFYLKTPISTEGGATPAEEYQQTLDRVLNTSYGRYGLIAATGSGYKNLKASELESMAKVGDALIRRMVEEARREGIELTVEEATKYLATSNLDKNILVSKGGKEFLFNPNALNQFPVGTQTALGSKRTQLTEEEFSREFYNVLPEDTKQIIENLPSSRFIALDEEYTKKLQEEYKKELQKKLNPNAPDKITIKQYLDAVSRTQKFGSSLNQLLLPFQIGGNLSSIGAGSMAEAGNMMAKLMVYGDNARIEELDQLTSEIRDIYNKIEYSRQAGLGTVELPGEEGPIGIEEARTLMKERIDQFTNAVLQLSNDIAASFPVREMVSLTQLDREGLNKVKEEALRLREEEYTAYTEQEREALKALDASSSFIIHFKDGFEEINGLQQKHFQEAIDNLEKSGILDLTEKFASFSTMKNFTSAQIQQALSQYPARLAAIQAAASAAGVNFKENKAQEVILTKDGAFQVLQVDMRIFQSLLEDIEDNTSKMVEGMFNLPEGMSFWVPYSAVQSYYKKQTSTTEAPPAPTQTAPKEVAKKPTTVPSTFTTGTPAYPNIPGDILAKQTGWTGSMEEFKRTAYLGGMPEKAAQAWAARYQLQAPVTTPTQMPDRFMEKIPEVNTRLNINMQNNITLLIDRMVLAQVFKNILADQLVRFGSSSSSGRTLFIR